MRCLVDRELGLCDAFIDGVLMEEVPGKGEVRSDLMSVADMCDAVEEKQTVESMMALMTKVANLLTRVSQQKPRRRNCAALKRETNISPCLAKCCPSRYRRQVHWSALGGCEQGYEGGAESKGQAGWSRICSWRTKG